MIKIHVHQVYIIKNSNENEKVLYNRQYQIKYKKENTKEQAERVYKANKRHHVR